MIPLLDLKQQYRAIQRELESAVLNVLESTQYALGPEVIAFEKEFAGFCGTTDAVGVNSGASALYLALRAAGVGPGDEVITVPFTFVATIAAIESAGARPVLVDIEPQTCTMDSGQASRAITSRTRALLPVHLYGQTADMDPLNALARQRDLIVIEDAAQAHGAEYRGRRAGSIGTMGCFSFYPAKNLGACGEAGAVTTSDPDLAGRVRMLRDWGQATKYVHQLKGGNFRMDGLQAAILRVKLRHLAQWNQARRERAARYDELLRETELVIPSVRDNCSHVYHLYSVQCPDRDGLRYQLEQQGIMTGIHYPVPVHLQPAYENLGYRAGTFPVAESMARRVVSLPMFPELSLESVASVGAAVRRFRPRRTS